MTLIEIPIRLRFLRIPTTWDIRTVKGDSLHEGRQYAFSKQVADDSLDAFKVTELDAWTCREEFFEIAEHDNAALLMFLTKMGVWLPVKDELLGHWSRDVMQHHREGHPMPIDVGGLWNFRAGLKHALVNKKAFKETYAPLLPRPETGFQMMQQSGIEFPMHLELTSVASGVITLTDAYHAMLATVFFDVARGIRFRTCEREDCGKPFPLENKHEKKFCCWYCAHITTVRRNRPSKAAKRKPRKASTLIAPQSRLEAR